MFYEGVNLDYDRAKSDMKSALRRLDSYLDEQRDELSCRVCGTHSSVFLDLCFHTWKEENDFFNEALNTFYLVLCIFKHMVTDHTYSVVGYLLPLLGSYLFLLAARELLHTPRRGCSSVDSVPAFEAVDRRIDPSQWTQLQFGLFSVPTSDPQLVYQRPWYVLFCLWKSAYKRSLAAYRKE